MSWGMQGLTVELFRVGGRGVTASRHPFTLIGNDATRRRCLMESRQ